MFKCLSNYKSTLYLLLFFLSFNTKTVFGQIAVNECNLKFNLTFKKLDSIPLMNKNKEIIKYWTQSEFNEVVLFINIDRSYNTLSRISAVDQVVIEFGNQDSKKLPLNTMNETFKDLWISNTYLKTSFPDWVFRMNRSYYGKTYNPKNENNFHIYSKPSTNSIKKTLDINDFYEGNSDKVLYKTEFLEFKGQWLKVNIFSEKLKLKEIGWMPFYNFCHNILTTCGRSNNTFLKNED